MDFNQRLEKLLTYSPHYDRLLTREPQLTTWLAQPEHSEKTLTPTLLNYWLDADLSAAAPKKIDHKLNVLKKFRQKLSLRTAYREVNSLVSIKTSLHELSDLADFCVQKLAQWVFDAYVQRYGTPIHSETQEPATYCILALGKLGGRELNFFSDIDLIYFFDASGYCHKRGVKTQTSNQEFFNRFYRELSAKIADKTNNEILYHLDLRLRPEGESGPICKSFDATAHYYWTAGQTWERLAWLKARPIAGNLSLGQELLEELNPFRYPRFSPQNILQEVSGIKIRTEKEVLGLEKLALNIKSGFGGIREIEYILQATQLIEGGRNPFIQTNSTWEALSQTNRYHHLSDEDCLFLTEAYTFLRIVENRLQIRNESQTHNLPETVPELEQLALSLGFESSAAFTQKLDATRQKIRQLYSATFQASADEEALQDWSLFLAGKSASPAIKQKLHSWFGHDFEQHTDPLIDFALGKARHLVTREQVTLFLDVSSAFDEILPQLGTPLATLQRVGKFADSYGARKQFLKVACNKNFFRLLCLLFDRSLFIHDLLCHHPEIMEELLYEAPKRKKSFVDTTREIAQLSANPDKYPKYLWLYIKAEQVRIAMGELLGFLNYAQVCKALTRLADAALCHTLKTIDPEQTLTVVALGKYGSREIGFGSDLDIIVLAKSEHVEAGIKKISKLLKIFHFTPAIGPCLEIDLRLRPYGRNSPTVATLDSLKSYHEHHNAQSWERQMLTRYRIVYGNPEDCGDFLKLMRTLLYKQGLDQKTIAESWKMRLKAEKEKASKHSPPERDFKSGPGGLMDIEFFSQMIQLKFGQTFPNLQNAHTLTLLESVAGNTHFSSPNMPELIENYHFLRRIELLLRRIAFNNVSAIPNDASTENALAKWMQFNTFSALLDEVVQRMRQNRSIVTKLLQDNLGFNPASP